MTYLFIWWIGALFSAGLFGGGEIKKLSAEESALIAITIIFAWPLILGVVVKQYLEGE